MRFIILFLLLMCNVCHSAERLNPDTDMVYHGAFRVPASPSGGSCGFEYGGNGMTFKPGGDPTGPSDGFPGSIFMSNCSNEMYVGEFSIPVPVDSTVLNNLNSASMLQNLSNITQGLYPTAQQEFEILYMPAQGSQTSEKLHISWNNWYNVSDSDVDRYGWSETSLSTPNTQGVWDLGDPGEVHVGDVGNYMLEIPAAWAASNTDGRLIIAGKYRQGASHDGGVRYGGGPALHAYAPWTDGNPPATGTDLDQLTLLSYTGGHVWSCASTGDVAKVKDRWQGGAWVEVGDKAAIVLVGRKGFGDDFYGDSPDGCEGHGYHNRGGYRPSMLFYDIDEIAEVANGEAYAYSVMPYTTRNATEAFVTYDLCDAGYYSAAYDSTNKIMYILEPNVDGERPVVHVYSFQDTTSPSITGSGFTLQ